MTICYQVNPNAQRKLQSTKTFVHTSTQHSTHGNQSITSTKRIQSFHIIVDDSVSMCLQITTKQLLPQHLAVHSLCLHLQCCYLYCYMLHFIHLFVVEHNDSFYMRIYKLPFARVALWKCLFNAFFMIWLHTIASQYHCNRYNKETQLYTGT